MWTCFSIQTVKPEKNPHLVKKKLLIHQGKAPTHTSIVAMAKIRELKFELHTHPQYLPALTLSDFYLCPNLKKMTVEKDLLGGQVSCKWLPWGFQQISLSVWHNHCRTSLGNMYWIKWRLCCEINANQSKKIGLIVLFSFGLLTLRSKAQDFSSYPFT